jgi:predicted acyltransferase
MHPASEPKRVLSLDVFRGFVIASMLLVNNILWNTHTPRQLMHAPWGGGVTFTDMILPWFIFAMGTAIPMSLARRRTIPAGGRPLVLGIFRRATVLVALGILLDSLINRTLTAGLDVLQLLGLAYLVAGLLGGKPVWGRLAVAGALLAGHWALLALVPVPGLRAGTLQHDHNIIQYLDATYFAPYHLAGILSVAPAAALALVGTAAGEAIIQPTISAWGKFSILSLTGIVLTIGGTLWSSTLPPSKYLWTSSYTVLAGGLGLLLLGVCYLAVDMARVRTPAMPLAVFGANPIVAYVAPILSLQVLTDLRYTEPGGKIMPLQSAVIGYLIRQVGMVPAMWIYPGATIVGWWLILLVLYRKRIHVRV